MKKQWCSVFLLGIILYLSPVTDVFGQKSPIKFGKPEDSELNMKIYPLDSSAHAAYLCDYGTTTFTYDQTGNRGWQLNFTRIMRIKVIDKLGIDAGDLSFTLYLSGADRERLMDVDGIVFNMEGGKPVKTKLEKSGILEEDLDKNHTRIKLAMPNVKEGSLIDIRFTINSDFLFNLQSWSFQHDYPVQWSEYYVEIPEYFIYHKNMKGYQMLAYNESAVSSRSITFSNTTHERYTGSASIDYDRVTYQVNSNRMAMGNVPAFPDEGYVTAPSNYKSGVSFELASTRSASGTITNYTSSWSQINEKLLEYEDFGPASRQSGFMQDEVKPAIAGAVTDEEKMVAIYNLVRTKMKWDGHKTLFAENTRKAWKENAGSSGEINLLLNAALADAGLDASPLALSTRDNGFINLTHPSISDLNYVIVRVKIGDKQYLLDATDKKVPFGLLPVRCLNGSGEIVKKEKEEWVDLTSRGSDSRRAQYILTLKDDGTIEGKSSHLREEYAALSRREALGKAVSMDEFYKDMSNGITGYQDISHEVINLDSLQNPLKENLEFTLSDQTESTGDLLLFNPLLFESTKTNPFRLKERKYPVEFSIPIKESLVFNWTLPEGYQVEALPKPMLITLPGSKGKFSFNISQLGNNLTVVSKIEITNLLFTGEEYPILKEFFNQIVTKQAEQVILKKS